MSKPPRPTARKGTPLAPKPAPLSYELKRLAFSFTVALSCLFGVMVAGLLVAISFVPQRISHLFEAICVASFAAVAGALSAAIVMWQGEKIKIEVVQRNLFLFSAGGGIAAFFVAGYGSHYLVSEQLSKARAIEFRVQEAKAEERRIAAEKEAALTAKFARQKEAVKAVNERLAEIHEVLPAGFEFAGAKNQRVHRDLKEVEAIVAEMEREKDLPHDAREVDRFQKLIRYFKAALLFVANDYEGALTMIEGLTGDIIPRANCDFLRGRCLFAMEKHAQSLAEIKKARNLYPKDQALGVWQGRCLIHLRDFIASKEAFDSVKFGEPSLVQRDSRPFLAAGLCGKICSHFAGHQVAPNQFAVYRDLDRDARDATVFLEQLAQNPEEGQKQAALMRVTIARVNFVAAGICKEGDGFFKMLQDGMDATRDLKLTEFADEAQLLKIAFLDMRNSAYRAKRDLTNAYADCQEALVLVKGLEDKRPKPEMDGHLVASIELNAGELSMAFGREAMAAGKSSLLRVLDFTDRKLPRADQITILRGRAEAGLTFLCFRLGDTSAAQKYAKDALKDLEPLEMKYGDNDDLRIALIAVRGYLKSVAVNAMAPQDLIRVRLPAHALVASSIGDSSFHPLVGRLIIWKSLASPASRRPGV